MNSYSKDDPYYEKFDKKINFLSGLLLKNNENDINNTNLVFQQILRSTYIMPFTLT
jgi:hypothetical protein